MRVQSVPTGGALPNVRLALVATVMMTGSLVTVPRVTQAQGASGATHEPGASLYEVVVTGQREADATTISEAARELVQVPGSLGDPLSAVFSLPGVVYAGGDNGAPAVRGSGPADNLFVVDSLPVPYVFHLFDIGGSVFSENILHTFNLYAAGYGPQYANVTGGVFDVALRDPKKQPLSTTVDVSVLRSGVFLESAVTANSAAYLSARVSNLSLFVKGGSSSDGVVIEKPPQDSDYQFRYVWNIADNQKLTLAASGATDSLGLNLQAGSEAAAEYPDQAGNARTDTRYDNQTLTWDIGWDAGVRARLALGRATSDTDATYGDGYYYDERLTQDSALVRVSAPLNPLHTVNLAAQLIRNDHGARYDQVLYICNEFDPTCNDTRRGFVVANQSLVESERTFVFSDSWRIGRRTDLEWGAQVEGNSYSGESFVNPRAALKVGLTDHAALSLKAGTYNRFPDLDTVLPQIGNPQLRSSRARHVAAGVSQAFPAGWSLNVEGYYKKLWNLPLALDPAQPDASRLYSNDVVGHAYGIDILLDKQRTDRWFGWVSASMGRSTRTDERTGATSDYYLDTPFIFNAIANYQWRPRTAIGARLTVRSGQPTTPIVGVAQNTAFPSHVQPVFGSPYTARLPTYARLDVRIQWDFDTHHPSSLTLDIINVLNRHNVDFRQLDYSLSRVGDSPILKEYEGLGILPVLAYRIRF
jgi:hypothetical protein